LKKEFKINKKLQKNKQPIMTILDNKRKELANMMSFQEKISNRFGTDDYIEALATTLSIQRSKFLPHASLFGFLDVQPIQIILYAENDKDAPKKIEKSHHSQWRSAYIQSYANPQDKELMFNPSLSTLTEWEKEQQTEDVKHFINVNKAALIESEGATILMLPDFIISYLTSKPIDHHYKDLFDFFVNKKRERDELYNLNQYDGAMKFLTRQVEHNAELYAFFKITEQSIFLKQSEFTRTTIDNFSTLKKIILGFEKELNKTVCLPKTSYQAKKYVDMIKESREKIIFDVEKMVSYWDSRLKESTSSAFKESGQFDKFKMLIDDIRMILPKQSNIKSVMRQS